MHISILNSNIRVNTQYILIYIPVSFVFSVFSVLFSFSCVFSSTGFSPSVCSDSSTGGRWEEFGLYFDMFSSGKSAIKNSFAKYTFD